MSEATGRAGPPPRFGHSTVSLVTGAGGGIGSAIVDHLVADGHIVIGFDARPIPAQVPVKESFLLDVTSEREVRSAVDQVAERYGRIDNLVNSAGAAHRGSFADTSATEFMMDIESNLLGTFLMCQAVIFPQMERAGHGRIVNIASISGKTGGTGPVHPDGSGGRSGPGYAAAKAGVINLTRWIARDVGRLDITCNAVAPGPIVTALTVGHHYDTSEIPLNRIGAPADVASAVSWLLSPGAGYVSGTIIDVDGGLVRA